MKFLLNFVLAHEGPGKPHGLTIADGIVSTLILFLMILIVIYLIKRYKK